MILLIPVILTKGGGAKNRKNEKEDKGDEEREKKKSLRKAR